MSADVPRRLPPTQGERVRNIDRGHASLSARGRTASARPVPQQQSESRIYQKPADPGLGTVRTGDSSGDLSVAIAGTTTGDGDAWATGSASTAVGQASQARADNSVAIGSANVQAAATYGIAIGLNAVAEAPGAVAIGGGPSSTVAYGASSVALGAGAEAVEGEIALGTASHHVTIPGALVLADGSGSLWRVTVAGGTIGLVAYP